MKTVLVGMSGGVDSSVSAIKLLNEGYNVIGATLSMGRKCDINAINDAKIVCEKLSIKHYVIDTSNNFKNKVVDYFVNSYLNGETPNPCSVCNRMVKFREMIDFMKKIGADYIATGHYAKIIKNGNNYELHKADCLEKDQSYFLSTIKYEFLQGKSRDRVAALQNIYIYFCSWFARLFPSHSSGTGTPITSAMVGAISIMLTPSSFLPGVKRGPMKKVGMVISSSI